jgi:hypothetical protein
MASAEAQDFLHHFNCPPDFVVSYDKRWGDADDFLGVQSSADN